MKFLVGIAMLACALVFTDASIGPAGVAFKGDNEKYLGRVERGGINYIEVSKSSTNQYTRFIPAESDGKLLLKADNGLYLSRVTRNSFDYIEAAKVQPDQYCYFTVHNQPDGTVVLQADNGMYMGRYESRGINYYAAVKPHIDVYCKLELEFQL